MARPKSYERQAVIIAAEQAFWTSGFLATGIDDLEQATGLGRSSLYLAFGSKQALFQAALAEYESGFLTRMLAGVEAPGAGLGEAARFFADQLARNSLSELDVSSRHVLRVAELPRVHRDPFDRLLVAQAQVENMMLLTADTQIRRYSVQVIW